MLSLSGSTTFPFSIDGNQAAAASDRFSIVFKPSVKFTHLIATPDKNDVQINFGVQNELNVAQYKIERSTNGKNYTAIETVLPAGNNDANMSYTAVDVNPGTNAYWYRIKATTTEGKTIYSDAVKTTLTRYVSGVSIFPNPVTQNTIGIQLAEKQPGSYNVQLTNANGQIIEQKLLTVTSRGVVKINWIPAVSLTTGVYWLTITSEGGEKTTSQVLVK